jgi:hypothetical protein
LGNCSYKHFQFLPKVAALIRNQSGIINSAFIE